MTSDATGARSATALLDEHRWRVNHGEVMRPREIDLAFEKIGLGRTLYNPAGWFSTVVDGKRERVFAARAESLRSETDSEVEFFSAGATGALVSFHPFAESLRLQDPFVTKIAGETILGGVRLTLDDQGHIQHYSTVFYRDRGRGVGSLEPFFEGPKGMKDIRLVELADHRVLVFTRPQGRRKGGRGQVGLVIIDRLRDLSTTVIENAPLIRGQFLEEEWGGVNAAYQLGDGRVGVLGHIARFTAGGKRQYYAVAWTVDPVTLEHGAMKIILAREDLPGGLERGHKRVDLKNVIFPAQLERLGDGTAILYGGEGDRKCFSVRITDPFAQRGIPSALD